MDTTEPTVTPEGVKLWEHQDEPGSYNTITLRYLDGEFVLVARHGLNFGRVTHTLTAEQVYDLRNAIEWTIELGMPVVPGGISSKGHIGRSNR